jgi:hypothetical protein
VGKVKTARPFDELRVTTGREKRAKEQKPEVQKSKGAKGQKTKSAVVKRAEGKSAKRVQRRGFNVP